MQKDNIWCKNVVEEFKEFEESIRLLTDIQVIVIPKKVDKLLRMKRYEKELLKIHKDKNLAIEYCLVFLSNFINVELDYNNQDRWKALSSEILLQQIPGSNARYKRVIELLSSSIFSSSPIIETKRNERGTETYEVGKKSKQYRLSSQFSNLGFTKYIIACEILIKHRLKLNNCKIRDAITNQISKNLLIVYSKVTLPTQQEILLEAKRLVKDKYLDNKGRKLTILNGRKKTNFDNRVAYEDGLKSYKYLIDNGLLVPTISGVRAGGRVYDSFNLMPSFIRNLIKIDNEQVVNVDFKCLHPNLSIKLYNGNSKFLTHQFLANKLKLNVKDVKLEHLSFFNKHPTQMRQSILFEYYEKYEPNMLNNIIKEKEQFGFKITSHRMLDLEVEIITECIKRLNELNVYPLYVFDALLVKISNYDMTKIVMNEVIKEKGVYTNV